VLQPPVPKERPAQVSAPDIEPVKVAPAQLEIPMLDKTPQPLLSRRRNVDVGLPPGIPVVKSPLAPAMPEIPKTAPASTPVVPPTISAPSVSTPIVLSDEKKPEPPAPAPPVSPVMADLPPAPAKSVDKPSLGAMELDLVRAARRRKRALWLRVVLYPVILAAIVGLGYYLYDQFRETRVIGQIEAPGYTIDKSVRIVSDFRDEARALSEELNSRRDPIIADLKTKRDALLKIKSDISGRTERQTLLQQELETMGKESETIVAETQKKSQSVWDSEGAALDADFDRLQDDFAKRIIERAARLKLPYQHNEEYKSPEVWVNAFRLALYDAPKTLNAVAEREWAEKELSTWRKASLAIDAKRVALKTKADEIKAGIAPKLEQLHARQENIRTKMADAESEITPLRGEQAETENAIDELKKQFASLEPPYREQLVTLPQHYTKREISVTEKDGKPQFFWPKIDQDPEFPPGTYWLLVQATRGDEHYWGFVPLTIQPWTLNEVTITDGTFQPVSKFIQSMPSE
jgi:peptidoglycan hydrolase CwlO-like protein